MGTLVDLLASSYRRAYESGKKFKRFCRLEPYRLYQQNDFQSYRLFSRSVLDSQSNRYDIKGRKYIGANLKYDFTDIRLRNARLIFRQQEPAHIMGNIVYNELRIRGYNVDTGVVDIYAEDNDGGRSRRQLEVDFAANGNEIFSLKSRQLGVLI